MKAAIIGGGLGGLAAAITLAAHGVQVDLFEKNNHFGGKMMGVDEEGYHFDFGPNTITMPEVFNQIIRQAGLTPSEELPFMKLVHHTRNQFPDGSYFDFSTDKRYVKEQLKHMDHHAYNRYDQFLEEVERLYDLSQRYFLNRTFLSRKDYLSFTLAKGFSKVRPFQSMDRFFSKYFSNPYLRQSLNRYATYIGSSPYLTPATFAMIAHLELNEGVFYVKGGNTKIAQGFVKAADKLGVRLHKNTKVAKILTKKNQASGVQLANGEIIGADRVILNGDLLDSLPDILNDQLRPSLSDKKINKLDPSISAYVILAGLGTSLDQLHHHHLVFSNDYKKEFEQLRKGSYAQEPSIYVSTSAKSDPSISYRGDNCFILVNAPASHKHTTSPSHYKDLIYQKLADNGLPIRDHLIVERVIQPADIERQFGAFKGSLYGGSSNHRVQAFMRPYNRSQDIKHLYFCGGSTHPGGGSPMVVLSGRNVANQIIGKMVDVE